MLTAARLAIADIVSPALRTVMLKSLGLTLLLLAGVWLGLTMVQDSVLDFVGASSDKTHKTHTTHMTPPKAPDHPGSPLTNSPSTPQNKPLPTRGQPLSAHSG